MITFNSCEKITDTVWVYYDETYCTDSWGKSSLTEKEKKNNIESYLDNLGVKVFKVKISEEGTPDSCFSCGCKSGNIIKCKIKEKDIDILINEGFYQ